MFRNIYFIGIGGIGMSALARYFAHLGMHVAGYDLTETPLTRALSQEGADIHYTDDPGLIPDRFRDPAKTLVAFTPAVPGDHRELTWFFDHGFHIEKRSEMLGHVTEGKFTMAVAGTHGKTTTATLAAWLNTRVAGFGSAFLGGISKNFGSNLVLDPLQNPRTTDSHHRPARHPVVVEADEFDRSFLRLNPDIAVITSVDPDHLDIYGSYEAVREAFSQFVDRIKPGGKLIINKKVDIEIRNRDIKVFTYSLDDPATHVYAKNLRVGGDGCYRFDIRAGLNTYEDCRLGIPGRVNVENAIAAVALFRADPVRQYMRFHPDDLRAALAEFRGVRRRFDIHVNTPAAVYMDDYAHHPEELSAALASLRAMFPERKITAVFQPHLYTRTRDLHKEFAAALSQADELILTPIYPARELPIEGVDSEMIGRLAENIPWRVVPGGELAATLAAMPTDVVVTFGAGNIENHVAGIAEVIKAKAPAATR